jgi:methylmalonyl-CoA/ethylmalonyl-CoA epimerase
VRRRGGGGAWGGGARGRPRRRARPRGDSPVARFLERNGPGVHHVGYGVADVAATLEDVKREGIRVVDEHPRPGSRGTTVAFVHPKGALGVLVELVEDPTLKAAEPGA